VDGWYRTGDLFRRDEAGCLFFQGREDDRFKVNGRWVSPVETETLLASACPTLGDAYVVPFQDDDGEDRPALIVHASGDPDALAREATEAVERRLERYKRPALVLVEGDIPLNKNGKPDRRAMARLVAARHKARKEKKAC
jgi:acyl-CoA synthetase (AMP-forming)/AMP-acid ligase II